MFERTGGLPGPLAAGPTRGGRRVADTASYGLGECDKYRYS